MPVRDRRGVGEGWLTARPGEDVRAHRFSGDITGQIDEQGVVNRNKALELQHDPHVVGVAEIV